MVVAKFYSKEENIRLSLTVFRAEVWEWLESKHKLDTWETCFRHIFAVWPVKMSFSHQVLKFTFNYGY